ncbi:hypothetical protein BJV82DRAFT_661974 [Fennellomyces sp. T-0311]|nr:hypothetical protein BJV82DRAFT_661974 [Fennellomyces sp. T-0311]
MDVEQNAGSSNGHESEHNQASLETAVNEHSEDGSDSRETADKDMRPANAKDNSNAEEEANFCKAVEDHHGESEDENDEDEDEDVSTDPDAARKHCPISKYLSKIQADLPSTPFFALRKKLD